MAAVSELPYLIRLLDDQDPAVVPAVTGRLAEFGGDISHDLAALGLRLSERERSRLSELLVTGRRETLRDEWIVPSRGASAMEDDWESFENVLRQISDFLHDGVTLRPSLSDSLDLLVDEIQKDIKNPTANELRRILFVSGRFTGAQKGGDTERYFDLCNVISERKGNPTSLGIIYMLVGYRMGVQVDGCNYPGHFLNKILVKGEPHLIDAFRKGRKFHVEALLSENPGLSEKALAAVTGANHLGVILLRYLMEMQSTYRALGKTEDSELFAQLAATLHV